MLNNTEYDIKTTENIVTYSFFVSVSNRVCYFSWGGANGSDMTFVFVNDELAWKYESVVYNHWLIVVQCIENPV